MLDFIHIGDYKTGTTWMQKYGFKHSEIHYLGDPLNEAFDRLFRELVNTRDLTFNACFLKEKFQELIEKEREKYPDKIIGVSREALTCEYAFNGEHGRRNAERLKNIFGEKIKIIYVIREQKSMVISMYSQYIKQGGTLSFKDFMFDPFETRGFLERLKYHKLIYIYNNLFGENNIHIAIFEEFKQNKKEFLRKVYEFIGCSNINYIPQELDKSVNSSLTDISINLMRLSNKLIRSNYNTSIYLIPLDKIILYFLSKEKKEYLLNRAKKEIIPNYSPIDDDILLRRQVNFSILWSMSLIFSKINFGKKIKLSSKCIFFLEEEFKKSNQILRDKYNLDIEQYDWSI